jgi:hypothetical protein
MNWTFLYTSTVLDLMVILIDQDPCIAIMKQKTNICTVSLASWQPCKNSTQIKASLFTALEQKLKEVEQEMIVSQWMEMLETLMFKV